MALKRQVLEMSIWIAWSSQWRHMTCTHVIRIRRTRISQGCRLFTCIRKKYSYKSASSFCLNYKDKLSIALDKNTKQSALKFKTNSTRQTDEGENTKTAAIGEGRPSSEQCQATAAPKADPAPKSLAPELAREWPVSCASCLSREEIVANERIVNGTCIFRS